MSTFSLSHGEPDQRNIRRDDAVGDVVKDVVGNDDDDIDDVTDSAKLIGRDEASSNIVFIIEDELMTSMMINLDLDVDTDTSSTISTLDFNRCSIDSSPFTSSMTSTMNSNFYSNDLTSRLSTTDSGIAMSSSETTSPPASFVSSSSNVGEFPK